MNIFIWIHAVKEAVLSNQTRFRFLQTCESLQSWVCMHAYNLYIAATSIDASMVVADATGADDIW